MGKVVKRIVLTGGPSAGKSSSLETIRDYFTNKGYIVYIVNESATELMISGVIPNKNNLSMIEFQDIVLRYQLYKENLIDSIADNSYDEKEAIIIYDRGLLDNKTFIKDTEFYNLLNKYSLNEFDLLNRYDLVIHLETGAKSKFYRTDNNNVRKESKEEAIEKDNQTFDAWKSHNNLVRIKCYDDFNEKQKEIIRVCNESLNSKEI